MGANGRSRVVGGAGRRGRGPRTERDATRRTLSQNFLHGPDAVRRYLDHVDIDPDLLVVEIGAGEGSLTGDLAARSRHLVAYELDARTAAAARASLAGRVGVEIVTGDFLASRPPDEPFQVVGNVPFGQTSAIVDWCLHAPEMTTATIITQLEYARKRTGWYGRWSRLTIQSWPWYGWELRGRIESTRFRPVPGVDAAVLHLSQRDRPLLPDAAATAWADLVDLGFTGLGGTLHASLSRAYPSRAVGRALDSAGLAGDTVVAFAAPGQWLAIFDALANR